MRKLSGTEFDRLVAASHYPRIGSKSIAACRLVLVEGMTIMDAARKVGVNNMSVRRSLQRIPARICKCCGAPVYEK